MAWETGALSGRVKRNSIAGKVLHVEASGSGDDGRAAVRAPARIVLALALVVGAPALATAAGVCGSGVTPIGTVQGPGARSPLEGRTVVVEGVVVGDFQGPRPALRGFYLQDRGDGDPRTSDGLFVFNHDRRTVAVGDRVRVRGRVSEFHGQTQVSAAAVRRCGRGSLPAPVPLPLPLPPDEDGVAWLERHEGMLVTFERPPVVTGNHTLGRFGELVLSGGERLMQPTQVADPGPAARARADANARNRILLDDAWNAHNRFPVAFPGPDGLAPGRTVRGGDRVADVVGVLSFGWTGHPSSPGAYRVRPIREPRFVPAHPRPAGPPAVGGSLRVAVLNVENLFTTLARDGARCGPPGHLQPCRGARDREEAERQWTKLVAAVAGLDADIVALVEVENDTVPGAFEESTIATFATRLNAAGGSPRCPRYRGVDPGRPVGTDVVAVALLHCGSTVGLAPGSVPAVLDDDAARLAIPGVTTPIFDGRDSNRAALAVTFLERASGKTLTVAVAHLKSKWEAGLAEPCAAAGRDPDCDQGDGQGFWNARRSAGARALAAWLERAPTGHGDPRILLVGDLNAYAREEPLRILAGAGYTDLVADFRGARSWTFQFRGRWGTLDYALASPALRERVTGAGIWHLNADEPSALGYSTRFDHPSLYAPDAYRSSDHDPVLVGIDLAR